MKWALVDESQIVVNVIEYDGQTPYTPPSGIELVSVNDWVEIGQSKDIPEPVVSIEVRREARISDLLMKREAVIEGGVNVNGMRFATDLSSQIVSMQVVMAQSAGVPNLFPRNWIMADGTVQEVEYADIQALMLSFSALKAACYDYYNTLVTEINQSNDPESIDIDAGWPE